MADAVKKGGRWKRVLLIALAILILLIAVCAIYVCDYYEADAAAIATFAVSAPIERIDGEGGSIAFVPQEVKAGLIFYPGGKVEHTAYIPLMQALAEEGILCVLIEMPFRLAVLDMNAADGVQERFPQVTHWYIGGHSLGGSMAASYLEEHSASFDGLILLAAYSTADLSATSLDVLSVRGSEDLVLNAEKYNETLPNLPATRREVVIEGGCHAYFGMYGAQAGDGIPRITNEAQIRQTVSEIAAFVKK